MADIFPTEFYQVTGILTCPNGDKLRSDAGGLFCWIDGDRVPAEIINGEVRLMPIAKSAKASKKPDGDA